MRKSRRTSAGAGHVRPGQVPSAPRPRLKRWHWVLLLGGVLLLGLAVYAPALRGPFVFDDSYLPFTDSNLERAPLRQWLAGVRPLLMLSFWVNYRLSELEPFSYHLLNVLLHFLNAVLVFLVLRRILSWAGAGDAQRNVLAAFAGGLFLLHPAQTEAVAYVASRSDALSTTFFLAALCVFLYRRSQAISWLAAAAVLMLFGAAVSTKENTAVLPVLLLLTDYYWNPGFSFQGIRRNWRLYVPTLIAGAAAGRFVFSVMMTSDTVGFALKEFTWYQYFFTQGRAIWQYIWLFFLPYGQTIDPDLPISRTVLDHGALFGLLGLAALAAAAIWYRRRFPLASYGFLVFLILLGPTSSIVPILDPMAERRLYLPLLGLLLVAAEFLRRWKVSRGALAAALGGVLVLAGFTAYARNQVWSSAEALWTDAVAKAPNKYRPRFQLGFNYFTQGRCNAALEQYQKAAQLETPDYRLLVDWGLAYDCAGQRDAALEKLTQAAALQKNAHVYTLIGMVYTKQGRRAEALRAFDTAIALNPGFVSIYLYRAGLYASENDFAAAQQDYRHALALDPENASARTGLALIAQQLGRTH